jgi:transcriptional regulator
MMDRRRLLMGLLASAGAATTELGFDPLLAQESASPDPSLYIPEAHLVQDRKFLHDFMDDFPFVDLVTASPALRITHIPVLLDRERGRFGTVIGHVSAKNPQRASFDGGHNTVIVFRGPHGYISPTWYASREAVPTWNFAVVHASGRPRAITDAAQARALLARLVRTFEKTVGSDFDLAALPESYIARMVQGIAPFEMEIDALEGKFKLGQDRSAADRAGILTRVRQGSYREPGLPQMTEALYRMRPPK